MYQPAGGGLKNQYCHHFAVQYDHVDMRGTFHFQKHLQGGGDWLFFLKTTYLCNLNYLAPTTATFPFEFLYINV